MSHTGHDKWLGLAWFGLVWPGLAWFGLVWLGLAWFGLVWHGLAWFGAVWRRATGATTGAFCLLPAAFPNTIPAVPEIALTTLNARYAHAAFGLRYLMANLGPMRERACILEFDISQRPVDVLEIVLAQNPRIVGVGVYIWNAEQALRLVADLKRVRPDVRVVLGGPEVSHEVDQQEICRLADFVITGEADLAFAELCDKLLNQNVRPLSKVIPAELPQMDRLVLPYELYDAQDVARRVIYVEASRGCPFSCEFCLSSLDVPVRNVPLSPFLAEMQKLLDRGVSRFKFVDRTFNLNLNLSRSILQFFLERYRPGLFLHFEMIPDRLPEPLRELIRQFPPGALQFEVGIQTFDEQVAQRISRRQDNQKLAENLRFLREETGVHVHADLIVGLPGEGLECFGAGFDRLVELGPQEIQVGILKRLRGTPIVRHDAEWGMVYSPHPPYEVLQTSAMDFATIQKLRRFSRFWDLIANSGNFVQTTPLIWRRGNRYSGAREGEALREGEAPAVPGVPDEQRLGSAGASPSRGMGISPFQSFMQLTEWLFARVGRQHGIALNRLAELVFEYLTAHLGLPVAEVASSLSSDYRHACRFDMPEFLRPYSSGVASERRKSSVSGPLPPRQARRLDRA